MIWVLLAVSVLCSVTGTLSLRASEGLKRRRWLIPMVAGYVTGFSVLSIVLARGMPVGVAYGIWAAVGVALTAVGARVFFKERLTRRMIAGVVVIAVGVALIQVGMPV